MKTVNYYDERDIKYRKKINDLKSKLPEFCSEYAISELSAGNSALTVYNYLTDLSIFFDYLAEENQIKASEVTVQILEELMPKDVNTFLECQRLGRSREFNGEVIESRSGTKALARKLSSIKSLYRYLFNNDFIRANITTKIPAPKIPVQDSSIKRLNRVQTEKMLDASNYIYLFGAKQAKYLEHTIERDRAIISFFLATGVRVSELVGLNIDDIDLDAKYFDITRKGGKIERLYFADDLASILKDWTQKRKSFELDKTENAFFISLQKKRMSVSAVEKMIAKYGYIVLQKKLSPHKLRATYGTELYNKTGDIYKVATALGHSSVDTTRKHYADIEEQKKKEIAGIVKVGR